MNIRAFIIDDELHARKGIRARLQEYTGVEIVGECSTGKDAVEKIRQVRPDLIFLDIQMPAMNGFEVLQSLHIQPMPAVIFVTAYDKYAIKAFEFHAFDYLLKPYSDERFKDAMKNVIDEISRRNMEFYTTKLKMLIGDYQSMVALDSQTRSTDSSQGASKYLNRLMIKTVNNISMLSVNDILWIEAADDFVYIHTKEKKHLYTETLSSFEQQLDPTKFARIHRSAIVHIDMIQYLHPVSHGDFDIQLKNGAKLRLSRKFRKHFQDLLKKSSPS
jgi:two-component system, LytTR family, response regulator